MRKQCAHVKREREEEIACEPLALPYLFLLHERGRKAIPHPPTTRKGGIVFPSHPQCLFLRSRKDDVEKIFYTLTS